MKNLASLILSLLLVGICQAQQSGTIKFTETIKLDIELPDGMEIDGMMDQSMTVNKLLHFDKTISLYSDAANNESQEHEMSSDDGSFKLVMKMDDNEDIFYTDLKEKSMLHQTGFMGKDFLVSQKLTNPKWKISNEKIKYLGYVCQKATRTFMEEDKEKNVVAWFTSELPVSIGPADYNQLPGAILMISENEGKTEIKATEVILGELVDDLLSKPKKGKKVTKAEYHKIMDEKLKEMNDTHGSERIMIRG